jgi:predicted metalloprotease with PDZ domain
VPIGDGREPVPWGEVQRGGGDAVHLYINQRLPAEEFMADWVLVHELSHLLHPVIDSPDRWLSEGIASYYQNVLRARAGLNSAHVAWNRLHAGFERGIGATSRGRSLAEASETMMRDRSFMRVYWSGAAIALLADVELRRRSAGAQSLDTALAAFRRCCLPAERSWSAGELMQKLDQLTGVTVFMDLYREHVDADEFPELGALYRQLGLQSMSATSLRLDPTAPGAAICEAIMSAPEG